MNCIMISLISSVLVIIIAYLTIKRKHSYWKNKIEHPEPNLLFGNFDRILFLQETLTDLCKRLYEKYPKAALVGFYKMGCPAVLIRDLNLVAEVTTKSFSHFKDRFITVEESVDPIFSKHPACLKGSDWKQVRKQLTPQFTSAKIKSVFPVLLKVCQDLLLYIDHQIKLNECTCFNVQELTHRYTGEAVFTSAFGLEGNSFSDKVPIAFQIGEEITGTSLTLKIKHLIGFFFPLLAKFLKTTFIGRPVPRNFRDIITTSVKHRNLHNQNRNDYMDYILKLNLQSNTKLQEDDLVGLAFIYYLDGFETSGNALTFLLYELAINEDVQEKCRSEVNTLLKGNKNNFKSDVLLQMKYIHNAIHETLRKHPPLTISSRVCTKDFRVPSIFTVGHRTDVVIPKGALVVIPSVAINYDPQYYPNPEMFNPDRFAEKNTKKTPFLGFGEGPRICLGKNFAMLQMQIFIASILSKYRVTLNRKTKVPYELAYLHTMMVPKSEIYINFNKLM